MLLEEDEQVSVSFSLILSRKSESGSDGHVSLTGYRLISDR